MLKKKKNIIVSFEEDVGFGYFDFRFERGWQKYPRSVFWLSASVFVTLFSWSSQWVVHFEEFWQLKIKNSTVCACALSYILLSGVGSSVLLEMMTMSGLCQNLNSTI